ncbi:MAG: class I SAM-dependent methyltransferase [Nitrososphaerota archaeon]|nr:class I SAM-dependent methyltransferase [Nitrososphaerota archaeon]
MQNDHILKQRILEANITVHRQEAKYYERLHPEVYSRKEQKRIVTKLREVDRLIGNSKKNALDVGAGTGNLTGKLLQMGYHVTAIDISAEMCDILKKKYSSFLGNRLTVINSPVEDLTFERDTFDLVTGYSVLHHLPDYTAALQTLTGLLKKGGVIYIDHEASPFYWTSERSMLAAVIKGFYLHSNPIINSLYFQVTGLRVPMIDYTLSDYWFKKDHTLNHQDIETVFRQSHFVYYKRIDYYQNATWTPNPLFYPYRLICKPEMSYWIAKK